MKDSGQIFLMEEEKRIQVKFSTPQVGLEFDAQQLKVFINNLQSALKTLEEFCESESER